MNPQRASRLVEYHARNPETPSLPQVIDAALLSAVPTSQTFTGLTQQVASAVQTRMVEALPTLAASPQASPEARALTYDRLLQLKPQLGLLMRLRIEEFERDPTKFIPAKPVEAPPGMPIGDNEW